MKKRIKKKLNKRHSYRTYKKYREEFRKSPFKFLYTEEIIRDSFYRENPFEILARGRGE